jgi:hypothetical protein
VEAVRFGFYWNVAQPYASEASIPVDQRPLFEKVNGRPTNFSPTDRVVALAAAHNLRVFPIVMGSPGWAAINRRLVFSAPRHPEDYAAFLRALIGRYGPRGTFWVQHPELPKLPPSAWQIWSEPDQAAFWPQQPFARRYVGLLRAAFHAVRQADRSAQVVLGSLTNYAWRYLGNIYKAGGRGLFDIVGINPFTLMVENVPRVLYLARDVMAAHGDKRKPIILSELSWPAALGKRGVRAYKFNVTERQQAINVRLALPLLARLRHRLFIQHVFWYTWMSTDGPDAFNYSGLRHKARNGRITSRPALAAYRKITLALEGR